MPRPRLLSDRTRGCWRLPRHVLWKSKHFNFIILIVAQAENSENAGMSSEVNTHHPKIPLEIITKMILVHFFPWLPQCLSIKCIYTVYTHTLQKLYKKAGSYSGFLCVIGFG